MIENFVIGFTDGAVNEGGEVSDGWVIHHQFCHRLPSRFRWQEMQVFTFCYFKDLPSFNVDDYLDVKYMHDNSK